MMVLVLIGVAACGFVALLSVALCKAAARGDAGTERRHAEPVIRRVPQQPELARRPLASGPGALRPLARRPHPPIAGRGSRAEG